MNRFNWPWKNDNTDQGYKEPTEADTAKKESTNHLASVRKRWPEVLRLKFDLDAERTKNHFAERWEKELRINAGRDAKRS